MLIKRGAETGNKTMEIETIPRENENNANNNVKINDNVHIRYKSLPPLRFAPRGSLGRSIITTSQN